MIETIFSDNGEELGAVKLQPELHGNQRLIVTKQGKVVHDELVTPRVNAAKRMRAVIDEQFTPIVKERLGEGLAIDMVVEAEEEAVDVPPEEADEVVDTLSPAGSEEEEGAGDEAGEVVSDPAPDSEVGEVDGVEEDAPVVHDFAALHVEFGTWAAVAEHLDISEYALRKLRADQE